MNDADKIRKFRERAEGWSLNDDKAWVKVKVGEMRAVLKALDHKRVTPLKERPYNFP